MLVIGTHSADFARDVLLTHTDTDPFNPDHPVAHAAVVRAPSLAAGAGVQSAFKTVRRQSSATCMSTTGNAPTNAATMPGARRATMRSARLRRSSGSLRRW
jgi:hypothetical protein